MDFTNIFKELLYDRQKEFNLEISSFLVTDHQQVVRSWSVADFVDEASKPLVVSYFKLSADLHEQNRIKRDLVNSQISSETKFTSKYICTGHLLSADLRRSMHTARKTAVSNAHKLIRFPAANPISEFWNDIRTKLIDLFLASSQIIDVF